MKDIINLITLYPNYFIFSLSFLSVLFLTFLLKNFFLNIGFVDIPSKRSNHSSPVALGGGIAIISIIATFSFFMLPGWNTLNTIILLLLFSISVIDDFLNVNILTRLFIHLICAFLYVNIYLENFFLDFFSSNIFLLKVIVYILSILSIAWFINVFNFMDGIDGITATYTITILSALIILNMVLDFENNRLHFLLLGSMLGFLIFNWHPAKIFLGDAGSIPIGFLTAHLLLEMAFNGFWVAAAILPLYYLMDTFITILLRIKRKEKLWESHSEHFYQKGIRNGRNHNQVCYLIMISSLGLFFLSYFAVIFKNNILFLCIGIIWCLWFLINFTRPKVKIKKKYE